MVDGMDNRPVDIRHSDFKTHFIQELRTLQSSKYFTTVFTICLFLLSRGEGTLGNCLATTLLQIAIPSKTGSILSCMQV